jgi:ribosomal protein S18 acetylase RimI-like enzyme
MLATLAVAQRVERMEIDFCALLARVGQPGGGTVLDVAGGRAVCSVPGAPMNKVLGLGLGCVVTDEDLDAIEAFYDERESPIQIELCPLVSPDVPARLSERGYQLKGFENELARPLPAGVALDGDLRVDVSRGEGDVEPWLRVTREGFASPDNNTGPQPPSPDTVQVIGEIMRRFVHPDIVRYLAWVDGAPAGAAGSTIIDGVLGIFGTATLPAYRRRGAQTAVVARALRDANGRAEIAIATTEPGSVSQRTFERLGFQVLYTRAILVRA